MDSIKIKIAQQELDAHYDEQCTYGYMYTVEASGNPSSKYMQKFFPGRLSGVNCSALQDKLDLCIYDLKTGFRHIESMWVRKREGKCHIQNSISFEYTNWDLPESLSSFIDRYASGLKESGQITEVRADKNEYGYYVMSTVELTETDDICKKVDSLEELQESIYRKTIIKPQNIQVTKYGEERRHWWIRYVIVPLIGSGAIAAGVFINLCHFIKMNALAFRSEHDNDTII